MNSIDLSSYPEFKNHTSFTSWEVFIKDYRKNIHGYLQTIKFYKHNKYPFVPKIRHLEKGIIFFEKIDFSGQIIWNEILIDLIKKFHTTNSLVLNWQEKINILQNYLKNIWVKKWWEFEVGWFSFFDRKKIDQLLQALFTTFVDLSFVLCHGDFHSGNTWLFQWNYYLFDFDDNCFFPISYDIVQWQSYEQFAYKKAIQSIDFSEFILSLFLVEFKSIHAWKNFYPKVHSKEIFFKKRLFLENLFDIYMSHWSFEDFISLEYRLMDYQLLSEIS